MSHAIETRERRSREVESPLRHDEKLKGRPIQADLFYFLDYGHG